MVFLLRTGVADVRNPPSFGGTTRSLGKKSTTRLRSTSAGASQTLIASAASGTETAVTSHDSQGEAELVQYRAVTATRNGAVAIVILKNGSGVNSLCVGDARAMSLNVG